MATARQASPVSHRTGTGLLQLPLELAVLAWWGNVQYRLWDPADGIMEPVAFSGRKGLLLTSCSNLGRNIVAKYTVVLFFSQLPGLQVWGEGNRSTKTPTSRASGRLCLSLMPDPIISWG